MKKNGLRRNTWLFAGFLLLGGLMHYFDPTENLFLNSFLFTGRFAVFTGLVLFWIRSVRSRLLPTRVRTYMTAAGVMMVCLLAVQVFSNRIAGDAAGAAALNRWSKYVYWIPQTVNPALFLMAAVLIRRGAEDGKGWDERLLLIPAALLSLAVITNDLHYLVYRPKADYPDLAIVTGRYSQGAVFYLLYAWISHCGWAGTAVPGDGPPPGRGDRPAGRRCGVLAFHAGDEPAGMGLAACPPAVQYSGDQHFRHAGHF